jgi:hypothetical protein
MDLKIDSETIYKYTVWTTARDALSYYLTQRCKNQNYGTTKQQTYKTMLDENKLDESAY